MLENNFKTYKRTITHSLMSAFIMIFFFTYVSKIASAEWEMPCDNGCTGEWVQNEKEFLVFTCPDCKVKVFWYERESDCNGTQEFQFYVYEIHIIGCVNCNLTFDELREYGLNSLVNFIIESAPAGQLTYSQMFLQSCWSEDLYGPHPVSQPCGGDCCRYRYTIVKDINGDIENLFEDLVQPTNCNEFPSCDLICNPNGYLYKQANEYDVDLKGLFNSKVYPNPNDGNFTIEFNSSTYGRHNLVLTDLEGNNIFDYSFDKENKNFSKFFNLNIVSSGSYFYYIKSNNNKISAGKLIIK